jgi:hypothetical protein
MSSTRLPRFSFRSFGAQVPIVKQIFTNIQRDAADEDDATGGPTGAPDCMRRDSTGRAAPRRDSTGRVIPFETAMVGVR